MDNASELAGLVALIAATLVPAILTYRWTRDPFDPRVIFPLCYGYLTAGPALWKLYSGSYRSPVYEDLVLPVLLSCSSAALAFWVGGTLALGMSKSTKKRRPQERRVSQRAAVARHLALLASILFLAVYAYLSLRMSQASGGVTKGELLLNSGANLNRFYYLSSAALLLSTVALVVSDAFVRRGQISLSVVAVLAMYGTVSLAFSERDVVLPIGAWILCNASRWSSRLKLLVGTVACAIVVILQVTRTEGLEFQSHLHQAQRSTAEDLLESILKPGSANFLIFNRVVSWIPDSDQFRLGRTYVDSAIALIPLPTEARRRSLSSWFKENYAPTGASGYGFAMDAEAYMNFGWSGPPIVFLVWGFLLGKLHRYANRPRSTVPARYVGVVALIMSVFAIRADSRTLLKMIVYSAIGFKLLWSTALVIRAQFRTRGASPKSKRALSSLEPPAHEARRPLM